jgi:hypothetical protein
LLQQVAVEVRRSQGWLNTASGERNVRQKREFLIGSVKVRVEKLQETREPE